MTDIRRAYADTESGQIHYAEAGTGEPLLLIAETPRGHHFFDQLMPLLAPDVRAIAVDLPGLGQSHPLPDPMSVPALAQCLVGFLDALGIARTNVFGMHTGDKVAAALASDAPGRVSRLILAGQTHSLIPELEQRNAALAPSFQHYHAPQNGPTTDEAGRLRAWLGAKQTLDLIWWPEPLVSGASADPRLFETAEAQAIDYLLGWRSAVPIYQAVFAYDFAAAVARIEAPTLVLEFTTPEESHFGPQAERLAALMRQATAASIPVTNLAATVDQAKEIAAAVRSFLQTAPT